MLPFAACDCFSKFVARAKRITFFHNLQLCNFEHILQNGTRALGVTAVAILFKIMAVLNSAGRDCV